MALPFGPWFHTRVARKGIGLRQKQGFAAGIMDSCPPASAVRILNGVLGGSCFVFCWASAPQTLVSYAGRKQGNRFSPKTRHCSWHNEFMPTCVRSADTERTAGVVLHDFGATSTCSCTVRLLFFFLAVCFGLRLIFYTPSAVTSMRHLSQLT